MHFGTTWWPSWYFWLHLKASGLAGIILSLWWLRCGCRRDAATPLETDVVRELRWCAPLKLKRKTIKILKKAKIYSIILLARVNKAPKEHLADKISQFGDRGDIFPPAACTRWIFPQDFSSLCHYHHLNYHHHDNPHHRLWIRVNRVHLAVVRFDFERITSSCSLVVV